MNKEVSSPDAENGDDETALKNVKEGEALLDVSGLNPCKIEENPWS